MISVLFSLDDDDNSVLETERAILARAAVQFHTINIREGRALFEAIVPSLSVIPYFEAAYAARNPIIVGVFNQNGLQYVEQYAQGQLAIVDQPYFSVITDEQGNQSVVLENAGEAMYPFDADEYLSLLPDKLVLTDDEAVLTERYAFPVEVHRFAGWQAKQFNEAEYAASN